MLQPKVLPKIIEQANTDGIQTTILLTTNGSLLASTGDVKDNKDKNVAALVSNFWSSYCKSGRNVFQKHSQKGSSIQLQPPQEDHYDDIDNNEDEEGDENFAEGIPSQDQQQQQRQKLQCLLLDCQYGRVAVSPVSDKVILCCCASKTVELGILRSKIDVLANYLRKPFAEVNYDENF